MTATPTETSTPTKTSTPTNLTSVSEEGDDPGDEEDTTASISQRRTSVGLTANVRNASLGSAVPISLDLNGPSESQPEVTLTTLVVELADTSPDADTFSVTVGEPKHLNRPRDPTGDVLGYVNITTDLNSDTLHRMRLEFEVSSEAIPETSNPEGIRLYQFNTAAGEWSPVGATYDSENEVYAATFAEPSQLAVVAMDTGSVEVIDAEGLPDWVRSGHTAAVTATVTNPGDTPATRSLTVTIDGEPVGERNVTLDPGEQREVTIEFDAIAGTVEVEGVEAGALTVGESLGSDDTPAGNQNVESGSGPSGVILLAAAFIVGLILAALGRAL